MAEDRSFELKVGLFVGMGILIFFIIVFSIGDITLIKRGYHIYAIFNFVNGITESSPVRLAGVDVGYIERINIYYDNEAQKTKVKLTAWINLEDTKIEKDARATINTLGLLGEKYLEIFPGTFESGILETGDALIGQDPVIVQNLTDAMNQLVESTKIVMGRLKEGKGTIGKLLVEEKIYNDLEAFVADIRAHPWKLLHKPRGEK